ncbi:Uncharacterized conserved protein YndB, AHSA1/START domain [Rhizobiales bacterium GAS113]|nr:Uncharacterized conserved protein YndB, AHSA1/START domain [Rhizobiales bacterium GAS113]
MTDHRPPIFSLTHSFDAPRELVFIAHSQAAHLSRWWWAKGFAFAKCTLDFRPGGNFHYCMRSPDGHEIWGKFAYREIIAPERIVFTSSFADETGATVRAPFTAEWPLEVLNTLTLTEQGGTTAVEMLGSPLNATQAERRSFGAARESVSQCLAGTFGQLSEHLAALRSGTMVDEVHHAALTRTT